MHNVPTDEVFVIGHKNPDTDSICSAIAYAHLKNQHENKYIPKRAGNINKETQFVLDYFGVQAPALVSNVNVQVKDIAYRIVDGVSGDITMKRAFEIMQDNDATTLPVVNNGKIKGIITVGDIAEAYMLEKDDNSLFIAGTKFSHIIDTINGELVYGDADEYVKDGRVIVGAAQVDILERHVKENDIVIVSDRVEAQLAAINCGASMLIVCLVNSISDVVLEFAKNKGCAWGTMDSLPEVPGIALRSDGHVGVYVGGGYAVEERGFSYGCVKTRVKDRSWTHWYFLPFIDYGAASDMKPPQTEYALGSRLLKKDTEGSDVKQLQEYLLQLGYNLPKYGADGDFGSETEAAVRTFQKAEGLEVDGKYGEKSHAALMDALSADDEAPEQPAQPEDGGEENDAEKPVGSQVVIVSEGGKVNIRVGNGTQYGRITQLAPGTTLDYVATAQNGWNAVVVNARVGWVSGEYSRVI